MKMGLEEEKKTITYAKKVSLIFYFVLDLNKKDKYF